MEVGSIYKMSNMKKSISKVFAILLLAFSTLALAEDNNKVDVSKVKHAKFIFLMIGDGMGFKQVKSAEVHKKSKLGKLDAKLIMNTFPIAGSSTTFSVNNRVTDSAAAATALACGRKTKNKVLGMGPLGQKKLRSIAFDAKERQMKVGLISSVPVNHATPAGFYANVPKRSMYYDIAVSLSESDFDFFGGSGILIERQAKDKISPLELARERGYAIVKNKDALKKMIALGTKEKILSICPMKYQMELEAPSDLTLAELTRDAISCLDNPNGFFLMVEGGRIDWACHKNDSATFIKETLAFDDAIKVAYDFYLKHPEDTLLVVTADHETGGLKKSCDESLPVGGFYKIIDAQKMPSDVFYWKYVSKWKAQKIPFEGAMKEIKTKLGLTNLTEEETENIRKAFDFYVAENNDDKRPKDIIRMYGSKNPVQVACMKIISKRCGIEWSSFVHSGAPVPVRAIGMNSELFRGTLDNTDISRILRAVILSRK